MKLSEYKSKYSLSYENLATQLGINQSTTVNICKGFYEVKLATAIQIVEKTNEEVKFSDLIGEK